MAIDGVTLSLSLARRVGVAALLAFATWTQVSQAALPHGLRADSLPPARPGSCVNFAGNWKGSCVIPGLPDMPMELAVYQVGCSYMVLNDAIALVIGGVTTQHVSGPLPDSPRQGLSSVTTWMTEWDAEQTVFKYKQERTRRFHSGGEPEVLHAHGSYRMEGKRLVVVSVENGVSSLCTFERK
jgi:hypothetical protein